MATTFGLAATLLPSTASATAPTAVDQDCSSDQLRATIGEGNAATGHRFTVVTFTNAGSTACRATGYPKVELYDKDGEFLARATESLTGFGFDSLTEVPEVILAPGQSAIAMIEGVAWSDERGESCLPYATLTVAPPAGGEPAALRWEAGACGGLEVHPVFMPQVPRGMAPNQ